MTARSRHTDHPAADLLRSQWQELERLRKAVLNRNDPDDIHDLRVASRRLRVTLSLLAPFLSVGRKPRRTVRRLTRSLGRLRNLDEARAYFCCKGEQFSPLIGEFEKARSAELRTVLKELRRFPARRMEERLKDALAPLCGKQQHRLADALRTHLKTQAERRFQRVLQLMGDATVPENKEIRHQLRIVIKKVRYLLEAAARIFGNDHQGELELLREYQAVLGKLNDMEEFEKLCERAAPAPDILNEAAAMLARDTAEYLGQFMGLAVSRQPQSQEL